MSLGSQYERTASSPKVKSIVGFMHICKMLGSAAVMTGPKVILGSPGLVATWSYGCTEKIWLAHGSGRARHTTLGMDEGGGGGEGGRENIRQNL
jgi:hypothetical protein